MHSFILAGSVPGFNMIFESLERALGDGVSGPFSDFVSVLSHKMNRRIVMSGCRKEFLNDISGF